MNKYIFCLAAAALTLGFTACEDVPAPYGINDTKPDDGKGETKTIFSANFDTDANGFVFQNVTLSGGLSYVWKQDSYGNKGYLKASAYANSKSNVSEAWAVSPAINLSDCTTASLDFRHAINKIAPGIPTEMYSVWASTDYAGNVTTATWTQLEVPSFPEGTTWDFFDAGSIDLTSFCGNEKVYIAYKYTSTEEASGTWEVDEFTITGDGTPMNNGGGSGTAQGDGSLENPFNALAATQYTSALATNVTSDKDVYIKGKIASIEYAYDTQYGNGSFTISEDGTTSNTFKVWRAYYLGNKKYQEGQTAIKVGDEVIVYGKVVNYQGTQGGLTPETAQGKAYLYSLNGVTESDNTPSTPDTPSEVVGENITENSSFETWEGSMPIAWKSTTTASNATLSQSTDAHSGSYSVVAVGATSGNKRLASKEYTLEPGTYKITCYVKGDGQVQIGYVPVVNGAVNSKGYTYLGYVSINPDGWTEVTGEFTLTEETVVNFLLMIPKTTPSEKLVDDYTVYKVTSSAAKRR